MTVIRGTRLQSVARSSRVLLIVATAATPPRAQEIAAALGVPLPTVYHLLNTLRLDGFLVRDDSRRYHLGPSVGVLADAYGHQTRPPEHLMAAVRQLAETTGESAYVSGWRYDEIVVLASVDGTRAVRVAGLHVGATGLAHARASGKLLLAFVPGERRQAYLLAHPLEPVTPRTIIHRHELETELQRIRERGYSIDLGEFREDVACVSAPVLEGDRAVAAITLSAPISRFQEKSDELINAALSVARLAGQSDTQAPVVERSART